ncbi:MAG: hypothetical protein R2694_17630 [Ilumatobacteraceae bacterium]
MTVTVTPEEFRFVHFDAAQTARIADDVARLVGIDRPVMVEIDETTPLSRVRIDLGDSIVLHVESGAFEDTKRPRHQSEAATAASLARCLLKARDRLEGGFGEAPADDDLTLQQAAAWDTYCAGRMARLGLTVNQQRFRYNYRNRFGFTDEVDARFERVWSADALTWGELQSLTSGESTPVEAP